MELDQTDLGFFHPRWTPSGDNNILVQDDTFHKLGVLNGTPDLFDDSNIS